MSNSPQFKSYDEGELIFTNIKVEKAKKGNPPLFNYNGKEKISSEEVGKEYYKSQGYNVKFSENEAIDGLLAEHATSVLPIGLIMALMPR